ncbi:hypothetical protein LCGC14_1488800 [marine sediment metagenome]|uniref:Uncharacterized protein n=1 Tax=marine sediment metagenome TaxID=412755 RepID=A0A0F9J7C8_9ZZZZ
MSTTISVDEKQLQKLIGDRNQCQDKITSMQHACNKELERRRDAEGTIKKLKGIIDRAIEESDETNTKSASDAVQDMLGVLCEADEII